ncbi:hypothetical protein [Sphingobium sp.]|uniref:hypothetical protein n=1 Tax=Sphingobium sp. TaxID=1912891 RepID=UPI003B3AF792
MVAEPKDGEQDQADVQDDEIEDLPEENLNDPDAPQDDAATKAEAQAEAAERREDEGGYQ